MVVVVFVELIMFAAFSVIACELPWRTAARFGVLSSVGGTVGGRVFRALIACIVYIVVAAALFVLGLSLSWEYTFRVVSQTAVLFFVGCYVVFFLYATWPAEEDE